MLKKVGLALLVVVAVLVIFVATRPAAFQVSRSITIAAPAQIVFGYLHDFHQWEKWSPWWKMEPTQTVSFSGSRGGGGAVYTWKGKKTGEGRMEILESDPGRAVKIKLDFTAPMKASNMVNFRIEPAANGVTLSWTMTGENGFVGKAFSLVTDMDQMVGKDFEKGLADLKSAAEADATTPPKAAP